MNTKLVRVYKNLDINTIKKHLLICGDLSANCASCNEIDLKWNMSKCPHCHTEFKYLSFRNIKFHFPKIHNLIIQRPNLVIIDLEDYQKGLALIKAEEFLK